MKKLFLFLGFLCLGLNVKITSGPLGTTGYILGQFFCSFNTYFHCIMEEENKKQIITKDKIFNSLLHNMILQCIFQALVDRKLDFNRFSLICLSNTLIATFLPIITMKAIATITQNEKVFIQKFNKWSKKEERNFKFPIITNISFLAGALACRYGTPKLVNYILKTVFKQNTP